MFIHTVYFWYNPTASDAAKKQLIDESRSFLGQIPAVKFIWVGVPANTPRDVVDNSYGVGLTVVMDDVKDHDVYQDHPLHLEFIKRNKATWQKVQIYDHVE